MSTHKLSKILPDWEEPVYPPVFIPGEFSASLLPAKQRPKRVDLHCHTNQVPEYLFGFNFSPLLNPLETYQLAKSRGMDYVAITDHDTMDGCKALLDRFGNLPDLIVGEEVTAAFPEDGMCVHINVFDINEEEHRQIQRLRHDIHELVPYLRSLGKCFQLNHFTWCESSCQFTPPRIRELLGYFDIFEVINGTRTFRHNSLTWRALHGLGKVYTAGSDSHTDAVGTTYTISYGEKRSELLANIMAGRTALAGEFGSPANTRRDARILLAANLRRIRRDKSMSLSRVMDEAKAWAIRFLYRPATAFYYLSQYRLMNQFELAAKNARAERHPISAWLNGEQYASLDPGPEDLVGIP